MEALFVVLLVLGIPLGLVVWLITRVVNAGQRIEELSRRLGSLERDVFRLKHDTESAPATKTTPAAESAAQPTRAEILERLQHGAPPKPAAIPVSPPPVAAPLPVVTPQPQPTASPMAAPPLIPVADSAPGTPPPMPDVTTQTKPETASWRESVPSINWERFMGVKLFAWIGGLALFIGVTLGVKYSFEHNLVPPELRVAVGFLTGLALLVGGVVLHRRQQYLIGAEALCATGVVILYAVTFACRSIYHFEFFGPIPTFLLMALITATAFVIAVRHNALVVAILGMLGGFLTPYLLTTGEDNPFGLFGYIAVLNIGLLLVALNRRWFFLTALAAGGTALMQIGWAARFFTSERYFEGNKILIVLGVLLGFSALYLAAAWRVKLRKELTWWVAGSALGLALVAFGFSGWFLSFETLAQRPWLIFGFVFLIDLAVTALALFDDEVAVAQPIAGLVVFGLLAAWTGNSLNNELLNAALAFYFIFAVLHSAFPIVRQKVRGVTGPLWGGQIFAPLALVLVLIPIFKFTEVSFIVWPFVLLVDLLAIALAVLTASLLPVLVVLLLTLAATGALIFKIPADLTGLPTSFFLLGAFAVFFVVASVWLARRFKPDVFAAGVKITDDLSLPANLAAQLPAFAVTLPFLLLIMATLRLPLANPSPVFGLALLLVVMLLGIARLFSHEWMPAIGLACVAALECAWHFHRFDPANPNLPLIWYLMFLAVFTVFPFLFLKKFSDRVVPWAAAALVGLPQFFLIHRLVKAAWPNEVMGLLPAAFAIPPLLGLVMILKRIPAENKARLTQLAWFGGVALFFITLIFPVQFSNQWITIGWALEGAALLWLFHRVPHPGLRLTGVGLLVAAFVRLALNPEVLKYQLRSDTPIFNWYLYAYGIVTVALFVGAKLLAPPRNRIGELNAPPILAGLGIVLAFLLLNIEIADFFSAPGSKLTFQFRGNFARDMTYSIAWALYALTLLVIGIWKRIPALRYAAVGLLSVTLLKLFFHDLARLDQLYRIGAFIAVAVIAILASFAYQRFYAANVKEQEGKDETAK